MSDIVPVKADQKLLNLMQEKHPGFHPALVLAEIACTSEDDKMRMDASKSLMPYVSPQLKSMEVHGEVKHDHGQLKVSIKPHKQLEPAPSSEIIDITPESDESMEAMEIDDESDIIDDIFGAE